MKNRPIQNIISMFEKWAGEDHTKIIPLPQSGSGRNYYRIVSNNFSAVGAFNENLKENIAYIRLTEHFLKNDLSVPKIYSKDLDNHVYLLEDLGDLSLFDLLMNEKEIGDVEKVTAYYKKALTELPRFQIEVSKNIDYSVCHPRSEFDKRAMMWDLNYFKYYFLKPAEIDFDEEKLEEDFQTLTDFLLEADSDYFMYRDFQARNIMIKEGELFFIDFQGGRKGAPQYDVASLLWSARADLPYNLREELLEYYLNEAGKYTKIDKEKFGKYYYGYVLIRILQTFGAYGFRGFYERKDHFLKSIPFAVKNLEWIIENEKLKLKCDELFYSFAQIVNSGLKEKFSLPQKRDTLKITITSFSYKSGIPFDTSGNGGGFVFDCRAIHNPGRYDDYKMLTGKDEKVIRFLEAESDVEKFLSDIKKVVNRSVKVYTERGFTDLMINFGCTGGQHRSVYCAERLADYYRTRSIYDVEVIHTELEKRADL